MGIGRAGIFFGEALLWLVLEGSGYAATLDLFFQNQKWPVSFAEVVALAIIATVALMFIRDHLAGGHAGTVKVSQSTTSAVTPAPASTDVRLWDEITPGAKPIIAGRTYTGKTIRGPAILLLLGNGSFVHCTFDGSLDAILWEIPVGKTIAVGVIGVTQCSFIGCRFTDIGIAGPPAVMAQFRADFLRSDAP